MGLFWRVLDDGWSAESRSLRAGASQAGVDALADALPLELGERREDNVVVSTDGVSYDVNGITFATTNRDEGAGFVMNTDTSRTDDSKSLPDGVKSLVAEIADATAIKALT